MAGRPPRPLPASLQRLVSVFEREGDAESEQASAEARNIGFSRARPSMADRPPRPLPASFQSHDSDSDNGMNADPVSQRSSVEILEVQPISAIADEEISCISDHSMSAEELEEDDLLDDEEEYQQVLEEQRIMDAKNGHFESEFQSPMKMTATAEEVAAYITRSLAVAPVYQDGSLAEDVTTCLEKEKVYGNPGRVGDGEAVFSEMLDQPFFENCSAVETNMHACMGSVQTLNAKPDSTSLVGTNKHGCTIDLLEKTQQLSSGNSRMDGADFRHLAPAGIRSQDLLHAAFTEETQQLDLAETRTLVDQQEKSGRDCGPQFLPITPALAQVSSSLDPSLSPLNAQPTNIPNNPQPISFNSHPTTHLQAHRPNPVCNPISNSPQPKHKQIKPKKMTQFKKTDTPLPHSSRSATAAGIELAVALFSGKHHPSKPPNTPPAHPPSSNAVLSPSLENFPPIRGSKLTPSTPENSVCNPPPSQPLLLFQSSRAVRQPPQPRLLFQPRA